MIVIDGHCDTITKIMDHGQLLSKNDFHVDIEKLRTFENSVQFFAVYLEEESKLTEPLKHTLGYIDYFYGQLALNCGEIGLVRSSKDIETNLESGRLSALLSIEGGEALEGELENLKLLYDRGVRCLTLTWVRENDIGAGSGLPGGLTDFGKNVVLKMNELGMIVDVSHLNDEGFWDVVRSCRKPFIASHSNAKKLCPHKRNLEDDQIKAIAASNGVIAVTLVKQFLNCEPEKAGIDDVLAHIDYILGVAGEDYLALGSDFDGFSLGPPRGFEDITRYAGLYEKLKEIYSTELADKIFYKNFLRVIKEVL